MFVHVEDGVEGNRLTVSRPFISSSLSRRGPSGKLNHFCTLPTKTAAVLRTFSASELIAGT